MVGSDHLGQLGTTHVTILFHIGVTHPNNTVFGIKNRNVDRTQHLIFLILFFGTDLFPTVKK